MTELNLQIVQEARTWIGTPYRHQAATKGAGADCLGLIRGVWRAVYGAEPAPVPAYSQDWSEPEREERLWQAAAKHLVPKPIAAAVQGDVILFRMRDRAVAKHLGILVDGSGGQYFIHAFSGHGVVENALSRPWRRRVVASFSFPDRSSTWPR